jgi:hypothetical protein
MEVQKDYKLKWDKINPSKIKDILVERHEFNEERVNKVLENLQHGAKKFEQTGLDGWVK